MLSTEYGIQPTGPTTFFGFRGSNSTSIVAVRVVVRPFLCVPSMVRRQDLNDDCEGED